MVKETTEIIEYLKKWQDEGYIKVLNWESPTLITLPKLVDNITNNIQIETWIDEYRNKFKGKKPGAMGDRNACIIKLKELFIRRPDLTKEKILAATDKYIQVESSQRFKYLMQADYFISKNTSHTKDGRTSKLEAYCDELDDNVESSNSFIHDI